MEDTNFYNPDKMVLKSPQGNPFSFIIKIQVQNISDYAFEISGPDPLSGAEKTCRYVLDDRNHDSYLNFFGELSADFGLRLPQNRRQNGNKLFTDSEYKEVLTQNLNDDILYGYGDPAVTRVEKDGEIWYYLIFTSNDAPNALPILRSDNLTDWEFVNFVFPYKEKPQWATGEELISDYWAPEMHKIGDEYRIYFVARDKINHELCIGMVRSPDPEGPFIADKEPVIKGNVIDPHVFVQDDETSYLFWKEDNNDVWPGKLIELLHRHPEFITILFDQPEDQLTAAFIQTLWPWIKTHHPMERFLSMQVIIETVISHYTSFYNRLQNLISHQPAYLQEQIWGVLNYMKTPMFAQRLSPDGTTLVGERTKIIENDLEWEAHLVEGMWVSKQQEKYYLFYAGNDFSTDQYGIGVAVAESLLGPYSKMEKPFLQSTKKWWAPGHPSIVTGPDGTPQLFFHAYFPQQAGYKEFRALLSVPLIFKEGGVEIKQ